MHSYRPTLPRSVYSCSVVHSNQPSGNFLALPRHRKHRRLYFSSTPRTQITKASSERKPKDPSSYASIEDLRRELEQAKGQAPFSISKSIQWLSDAANSSDNSGVTGKSAQVLAFQAYKFVLGITPPAWRPPDDLAGPALVEIEASVDSIFLEQLQTVLLSTKITTLKLMKRYPKLKTMDISDLMVRLVSLKGLFPGSDVARMIELLPSGFLGSDWPATEQLVEGNSQLLRQGLHGADVDFLFQEDPTILFEETESLRVGLRRLKELWDIDSRAMANSDPLELSLAVKALGLRGAPKTI